MSHLSYIVPPGPGETLRKKYWFSQAVQIGDRIEISGQTGTIPEIGEVPPDIEGQTAQAFKSIDCLLRHADSRGFRDVYKITSYHVGMDDPDKNAAYMKAMRKNMEEWCPDHQPLWTMLGVAGLALGKYDVEIEVIAHVETGKKE